MTKKLVFLLAILLTQGWVVFADAPFNGCVTGKGHLRAREILAESREPGIEKVLLASRESSFTGRGNENETLTTLTVSSDRMEPLRKVLVRLDADASDVSALKVMKGDEVLGPGDYGSAGYRIPAIITLPDGRILMSVRRQGERGFNISDDGGMTWGHQDTWPEICVNACDGDIINLGDSLLLQSVPNSMRRENVSIFASRDNGKSWPYVKSICPYESVYSAMTLLPDGTIGMYYEENPFGKFDMYFINFSPEWLLNEQK